MAQYQHPKDRGRTVEVAEGEGAKVRILTRLGWKLVPQGQETQPAAPAPKQGKQAAPTTADPQPLNVKTTDVQLRDPQTGEPGPKMGTVKKGN